MFIIEKSIFLIYFSCVSIFRGLLQFENVSYGIEPLESSTTYEHVIYPFRDKKSDFSPISENSSTTQFADQSYKILVKSNVSNSCIQIVINIFTLISVTFGKQI